MGPTGKTNVGAIPALLTGRTYDLLGWNRAATLVFGYFERIPANERNALWLLFSKTHWGRKIRLFVERDQYAKEVLETFRGRITGHQADPEVLAFIERLQQASPTFREFWAEHNVRSTCATRKQLQHPLVGKMTLDYAKFQVIEHPDIRCHMYLAADAETAHQLHRLLNDEPCSVESI